jgi:hypothetical protein
MTIFWSEKGAVNRSLFWSELFRHLFYSKKPYFCANHLGKVSSNLTNTSTSFRRWHGDRELQRDIAVMFLKRSMSPQSKSAEQAFEMGGRLASQSAGAQSLHLNRG